jgi:hypothetical protein
MKIEMDHFFDDTADIRRCHRCLSFVPYAGKRMRHPPIISSDR